MCRSVDHWVVVLLLGWLATAVAAGVLQHRFARRLKKDEPALWNELSTWHRWNENSELHESAVFSYLIQGLYKNLPEGPLAALGGKAHGWMLVSLGMLLIYGSLVVFSQAGIIPSCYWR